MHSGPERLAGFLAAQGEQGLKGIGAAALYRWGQKLEHSGTFDQIFIDLAPYTRPPPMTLSNIRRLGVQHRTGSQVS